MPLVVHRVEISLAMRLAFSDGSLDRCLCGRVSPLAWRALAAGV